ncbi:DUF4192 domain-containing protein [Actinomadura sp. ATCC 31491]|uniref:DUF4192 domain-containing protein n=1 Tax=Actinomadura luzonensis TaxID=2805427 RepID=A0ABT0FZT4_9ACTN|nr:DUF4192 domain-containing protein [Actinomadura luzonensis]MCK2217810.1 DUF4192 domain-containing protein [Actinomadura luzonensis]
MTTNTSPPSPPPSPSPSPPSSSSPTPPTAPYFLTLRTPADILAAIPYLVGFHPTSSLVVVGIDGGQAKMVVRWGLPLPPGTLDPVESLFRREGVTEMVAIGYGPGESVTPAMDEARRAAARAGVRVGEALRAHEGRYWSYVCDLPSCCPAEGTPYDSTSSRVAAEATVRGLVALPDRETLEHTLSPVTGPVRLAMRRATSDAVNEVKTALAATPNLDAFTRRFVAEGLTRVRDALSAHTEGRRLSDAEAARLGLDLAVVRIRDEAWTCMHESHAALWKDLTRRLEPRFAPPAASLLAMAAWRAGDSVLATVALERALAIDPGYSMAGLLMHAVQNLLSPAIIQGRMPTPTELDDAMGTAHAGWLLPLAGLLIDEDDPPPQTVPHTNTSRPASPALEQRARLPKAIQRPTNGETADLEE